MSKPQCFFQHFFPQEEKLHIAENHLLPKQLVENGLDNSMIKVPLDTTKLLSMLANDLISHFLLIYTVTVPKIRVRHIKENLTDLCNQHIVPKCSLEDKKGFWFQKYCV